MHGQDRDATYWRFTSCGMLDRLDNLDLSFKTSAGRNSSRRSSATASMGSGFATDGPRDVSRRNRPSDPVIMQMALLRRHICLFALCSALRQCLGIKKLHLIQRRYRTVAKYSIVQSLKAHYSNNHLFEQAGTNSRWQTLSEAWKTSSRETSKPSFPEKIICAELSCALDRHHQQSHVPQPLLSEFSAMKMKPSQFVVGMLHPIL